MKHTKYGIDEKRKRKKATRQILRINPIYIQRAVLGAAVRRPLREHLQLVVDKDTMVDDLVPCTILGALSRDRADVAWGAGDLLHRVGVRLLPLTFFGTS